MLKLKILNYLTKIKRNYLQLLIKKLKKLTRNFRIILKLRIVLMALL